MGEQAGYWGQKAKDTLQGFLPGSRAAHSKVGSDLESLHQDLINGNFPVNDRAKLDEWLAQRSKGLTDSQKGWYEAVQGKPDLGTDKGLAQHIYTHANSLLHPANAELLGRFIQTRDPAVWKELHQNLTRTPQRAETDKAQSKSLEESKIVHFMTNNYGGGDYKEHMISAGDPIEIASNLIPVIRGARAGKAAAEAAVLAGKSTAKRSVGALAKSAAIDLGIGGVQTLIDNPDATFADHMQAGKENIATALGLHAAGHAYGKLKGIVTGKGKPGAGPPQPTAAEGSQKPAQSPSQTPESSISGDKPSSTAGQPLPPVASPESSQNLSNPDGPKGLQKGKRKKSGADMITQLKEIEEAQNRVRKGKSKQIIDSISKSKQNARNQLRDIARDPSLLDDLD